MADNFSSSPQIPIWKCGCGYGTVVERPYCPKCHDALSPSLLTSTGVVLSWTIVHVLPFGETVPYGLAMIGLDHGINAMARFDANEAPDVGSRVCIVIGEDGLRRMKLMTDAGARRRDDGSDEKNEA